MKKLVLVMLLCLAMFVLTACGSDDSAAANNNTQTTDNQTTGTQTTDTQPKAETTDTAKEEVQEEVKNDTVDDTQDMSKLIDDVFAKFLAQDQKGLTQEEMGYLIYSYQYPDLINAATGEEIIAALHHDETGLYDSYMFQMPDGTKYSFMDLADLDPQTALDYGMALFCDENGYMRMMDVAAQNVIAEGQAEAVYEEATQAWLVSFGGVGIYVKTGCVFTGASDGTLIYLRQVGM